MALLLRLSGDKPTTSLRIATFLSTLSSHRPTDQPCFFCPQQTVTMGQVNPRDVQADHVELTIKGQFMPRGDLYRFLNSVNGQTAWGGKVFDVPVSENTVLLPPFPQFLRLLSYFTLFSYILFPLIFLFLFFCFFTSPFFFSFSTYIYISYTFFFTHGGIFLFFGGGEQAGRDSFQPPPRRASERNSLTLWNRGVHGIHYDANDDEASLFFTF